MKNVTTSNLHIGFVGLTHLGLNSAAASAARGVQVTGFDENLQRIESLRRGQPEITEPNLQDYLEDHSQNLAFTSDIENLCNCEIVYISVDVATDDQGQSDLTELNKLIQTADESLPPDVILVILSQVPPGFTRKLKLLSGRQYFYQVETLIFGRAVERAMYPERFIVGTPAGDDLPESYLKYLSLFDCPVLPMQFESAELCKISINCCLVASVTVANTLAEICENTGADWAEIVPALKLDKRIGPHAYLTPGLGISGGNLERDLNTVVRLSEKHQTDAKTVKAWIDNSQYRKDWVYRIFKTLCVKYNYQNTDIKVAIWGLTYKPDTHSVKNSPSLRFISKLSKDPVHQVKICAYDPVINQNSSSEIKNTLEDTLGDINITLSESATEACKEADILIIMTSWNEFSGFAPGDIMPHMDGEIIIDPYRCLDKQACESAGIKYKTLGVSACGLTL